MSNNVTLSVSVENEIDLKPAGTAGSSEPLFQANWFKVTEQISRTYLLRIRVVAHADDLDLSALVGRRLTLTVSRDLQGSGMPRTRNFYGVIWSAQQRHRYVGQNMYYYWLDVRPAVHALSMSTASRVYGTDQKRSVPEIIDYCLTGRHEHSGTTQSAASARTGNAIKSSIASSKYYKDPENYEKPAMLKEFVVQYNESDLAFMSRLMEKYGIFYFFDPYTKANEGCEDLVVADHKDAFGYASGSWEFEEATALTYVQPSQFSPGNNFKVKNFIARHSLRPTSLKLDDFNYRGVQTTGTETGRLSANADLDSKAGEGSLASFGENYVNAEEDGALLCQRRAEQLTCDQEYFTGQSDCFELAAGYVFRLKGHFRSSYNVEGGTGGTYRPYLVTEVAHECSVPAPGQAWDDAQHGYSANFTAIDANQEYRPPRVTPVPVVPGFISATIDATDPDDDRADLDDQGRYLAHLHFDRDETLGAGQRSPRIRMCQPYGGLGERGMHFPLVRGTEVMVAFLNGDLDRPIIVGTVPNPANGSPVTANQQTRNRLVTTSAITLELEDGRPETAPNTRSVWAPPPGGALVPSAAYAGRESGNDEGPGESQATVAGPENWARLYLSHQGKRSYLRMGAVPADEAKSAQLKPIGGKSRKLRTNAGWIDYTESDRAHGTAGERIDIVGGTDVRIVSGKQKITVVDAATPPALSVDPTQVEPDDAGRTLLVSSGGTKETVYGNASLRVRKDTTSGGDHSIVVEDGDQLIQTLSGVQSVLSGTKNEIAPNLYDGLKPGDQVLGAAGDQEIRCSGNQHLRAGGDQIYDVIGNQTGTVHGHSGITYLGDSDYFFKGHSKQTYIGTRGDYFLGVAMAASLAIKFDANFAASFYSNWVYGQYYHSLLHTKEIVHVENTITDFEAKEVEIKNVYLGVAIGFLNLI